MTDLGRLATGIASEFFAEGYDRDDMRQEALIAAWLAELAYEPDRGASLATWVQLYVRGRLMSVVSRSRSVGRGAGVGTVPLPDTVPDRRSTEDVALLRLELHALAARMAALTPIERRALVASVNGRPLMVAGVKDKQADNALQRARRKLAA